MLGMTPRNHRRTVSRAGPSAGGPSGHAVAPHPAPHPAPHLERGARAEAHAAAWLEQQGLVVIERNWRCRFGEIDLILCDGDTLVFAEVRLRGNPRFGGAAASIDARKQARLAASARMYLARSPALRASPCRFDAVLMNDAEGAGLEWIRNAFDA